MAVHIGNADIVMIVAFALLSAVVIAIRFKPQSLRAIICDAIAVNVVSVLAVAGVQTLPALFG